MMNDEEIQGLMAKWGLTVALSEHVFTWTERETLAWLAEQSSKAKLAAEIGTYMGRSALVMMQAGCGHLWACDPFMVDGTYECTKHFLGGYGESGRCEIIRKRSAQSAAQLSHVRGQLDLVFVDDGHAYDDVILDINSWLPMLRPGGLLCGHDFEQPDNDVARAVKELLPGYWIPLQRIWAYIKP